MNQTYLKNIAIIGAGGQIGRYIVQALLEQGKHNVTAITRPSSNSNMPSGLTAVKKAEYDSHSALVEALYGQDVLVISLNGAQGVRYQRNIVDAAVEARVRYIVPNEYANDREKTDLAKETIVGQSQLELRQYIEQVGKGKTHWIAITCGFWYESSLGGSRACFGFDIPNREVTFFDNGTTKVTTVTRRQCARAVARLFALPVTSPEGGTLPCLSDWENKALYIGDFHVSQRDMLDALLRVTGTQESAWIVKHETSQGRHQRALKRVRAGDFSAFVEMLYARTFYPEDPGEFQSKVQNKMFGLPEESLDEATRDAIGIADDASHR